MLCSADAAGVLLLLRAVPADGGVQSLSKGEPLTAQQEQQETANAAQEMADKGAKAMANLAGDKEATPAETKEPATETPTATTVDEQKE